MLKWLQRLYAQAPAARGPGDEAKTSALAAAMDSVLDPLPAPRVVLPTTGHYPRARASGGDSGADVFDPALAHCPRAFRRADPEFADAAQHTAWLAARQGAIDHVLRLVAASPWARRLALRGSVLMPTQVGAAARPPRDIDWMVLPPALKITDPSGQEIVEEIGRLIVANPQAGHVTIDPASMVRDRIWTYERANGLRMSLVWTVAGLPPGSLQLDFVFGEPLAELAEETAVLLGDGGVAVLPAASAELSLCWKLLWLANDNFPQGKDLYDAVLLAERGRPEPALLQRVLEFAPPSEFHRASEAPLTIAEWGVDWDNFLLEYPQVQGDAASWKQRLAAALSPELIEGWTRAAAAKVFDTGPFE